MFQYFLDVLSGGLSDFLTPLDKSFRISVQHILVGRRQVILYGRVSIGTEGSFVQSDPLVFIVNLHRQAIVLDLNLAAHVAERH